ncbi:MAG: nucleoside hydrolase [Pseudomonadota bacterium]
MPRKILIDTDPGIDDAMAIVYALSDPELELLGLTTVFGNVPVEQGTRNALALVKHLNVDVPVAEGAARPLEQTPAPHPDFVHGKDGFGGVALPESDNAVHPNDAADFIIDTIRAYPGEVTLVPVGPLTNIAEAIRRDPGIAELVRMVVIMGGAYARGGNVTEFAEANIWQDPHAAEIVFATNWPMIMVGLNVTEQVQCTQPDFDVLGMIKPVSGAFLRDAVKFYIAFHRERVGVDGCFLHDPSAVIAAIAPDLFKTEEVPLTAICGTEKTGATVPAKDGRTPVKICVDVDQVMIRRRFFDMIGEGPLP